MNCVREDEYLEGERKILQLTTLGYIFFLFVSGQISYVFFFFFFSNKLKIQKNYGICGYVPEFPSEQRYLLHARKVYQPPKRKAESMAWCQLGAGSIKAKITLFRLLSIKLR